MVKRSRRIWTWILEHSSRYHQPAPCPCRWCCLWADACVALAESYYRWRFWLFIRALSKEQNKQINNQKNKPNGLVMVTRALNPCGSIHQAVLLLEHIQHDKLPLKTLLCLHLDSDANRFYLARLMSQNIPVETLQVTSCPNPPKAFKKLPNSLKGISQYYDAINRHLPSVIHSWQDNTNIKMGLLGLLLGTPRIVLSTSQLPPCHFQYYRPFMRAAYQLLLKYPHVHMVNNSHYGARAYEAWLGLEKGRIRVIPNAFPFDQETLKKAEHSRSNTREEYGIPINAAVIGAVMRLSEEKQPLLWLQIAYFLHQRAPDLRFLLIGDGPLRSVVEHEIDHMGLSQVFHRINETKDSLAAIAAMDLMLFTPRAEGLANCLIEAQALGVPIVSTAFGGEAEAILIDQTGWIIEANNPKASADRILEILRSEQHLSRAKHLGPQFVKENFGVVHSYQQYAALYSQD